MTSAAGWYVAGTVKWYSGSKNYGFIVPNGGGADVFFHRSTLQGFDAAPVERDKVLYQTEAAPDNSGRLRATVVKRQEDGRTG